MSVLRNTGATTLSDLASHPRWVGWRTERRNDDTTKVPYAPHLNGRKAEADNAATWATRAEAEKWASTNVNGEGGGIGFELGDLGNGIALGGFDLDTCRDPATGEIAPWALDVIRMFGPSYCEVSPSGAGVKGMFLYASTELPSLLQIMGTRGGRKWARGKGKRVPAIELYLTGRFFAITDLRLLDSPAELRHVPAETISQLIRETGPAFAGKRADHSKNRSGNIKRANAGGLWDRIAAAAIYDTALQRLLNGDFSSLNDQTRSALDFALGAALKRNGFTFCEMRRAIIEWQHGAGREKQQDERYFTRIWERSATRAWDWVADPETQANPDLSVLRLHRRPPPTLPIEVFGERWAAWLINTAH
ncbi:MAG: hypothetical protein JOY71_23595, partial [Acetobacteraceae bacterium]|nr:hypothetical protein [Acetobacteraceae bacterium]